MMEQGIRLDKLLGEMGAGSRSQIKELAREGRITVNGEAEKKTSRKVVPGSDEVAVDGRPVVYAAKEYFMLHKPCGVVSATEDKRYQTVVDLIAGKKRADLFPVGRLDIDTEGLLLITNDGELAHRLLSPKRHVDKVYEAELQGELPEDAKKRMREGLTLADGTRTLPAELEILGGKEQDGGQLCETRIRLTIHEGKFHQVKRMFEALGCHVAYLKRVSMGPLRLDENLRPGEYRPLTGEELRLLGILETAGFKEPCKVYEEDEKTGAVNGRAD